MRLLIALPDAETACGLQLEMEWKGWNVSVCRNGSEVLLQLQQEYADVLLLHACLAQQDGFDTADRLSSLLCPPRILFLCPPEYAFRPHFWADCTLCPGVSAVQLCCLIEMLAQKPLPKLTAVHREQIARGVEEFLVQMAFSTQLKGRAYAAWMLERLIPAPHLEQAPLEQLYRLCAEHFGVKPAAVERCVRIAIENVFTQGSLQGIERYFGATIDPERGKPTNRAFLLQAVQLLRDGLTPLQQPVRQTAG